MVFIDHEILCAISSIQVIPEVTYSLEAEPLRRVARVDLQGVVGDENILRNKKLTLDLSAPVCVTELALVKVLFWNSFSTS